MDLRDLEPGETFEGMPLVCCPICSKTAIHLGLVMDDSGLCYTQQIYAHVVSVVEEKAEILEACELKPTD